MKIDDALIEKLSGLSRLYFNEVEKAEIKKDLEKMIGFIGKLNELDTHEIEPLLHITDNTDILREDFIIKNTGSEEAPGKALAKDKGFFKVPKVIKR